MTKRIASLISLALLAAVSASAQIAHTLKVDVPFSFSAAGSIWEPGVYQIDLSGPSGVSWLHSSTTTRAFLAQRSDSRRSDNIHCVRFERYGDRWVLRSIVLGGSQAELIPGKLEQELMTQKRSENRTLVAHLGR
jgi:hypothetical protein